MSVGLRRARGVGQRLKASLSLTSHDPSWSQIGLAVSSQPAKSLRYRVPRVDLAVQDGIAICCGRSPNKRKSSPISAPGWLKIVSATGNDERPRAPVAVCDSKPARATAEILRGKHDLVAARTPCRVRRAALRAHPGQPGGHLDAPQLVNNRTDHKKATVRRPRHACERDVVEHDPIAARPKPANVNGIIDDIRDLLTIHGDLRRFEPSRVPRRRF